jgi:hypothetical protein
MRKSSIEWVGCRGIQAAGRRDICDRFVADLRQKQVVLRHLFRKTRDNSGLDRLAVDHRSGHTATVDSQQKTMDAIIRTRYAQILRTLIY